MSGYQMQLTLKCLCSNLVAAVSAFMVVALSAGAAAGGSAPSDIPWEKYQQAGLEALNQGHLDAAEDLFKQAIKAAQRSQQTADELVESQNGLARVLTLEARADEAEALFKRSLGILRRIYGARSTKLVPTMLELGSIFESEGDHPAAMALYNRVLSINQADFGPDHPAIAHSLHRLGQTKTNAGKPKEAEADYRRALAILEKQPADDELEALLKDYADLLRQNNRPDEAAALERRLKTLKEARQIKSTTESGYSQSAWQLHQMASSGSERQGQTGEEQRVLNRAKEAPFTDSRLGGMFDTLADVHYQQGRFAEAEPLYKNILRIDEKTLGPIHPGIASDLTNLALLYVSDGKYREAEPLLKRALSIYEANYGTDNLLVIKARSLLASVYEHLGNLPQAETNYKEALELGKKELGPNNIETARILNNLAFLYYHEGKLNESDTLYKWALASTEGALGPQDPAVAACLQDYAQVLRKLNRTEEADKLEARANSIKASTASKP